MTSFQYIGMGEWRRGYQQAELKGQILYILVYLSKKNTNKWLNNANNLAPGLEIFGYNIQYYIDTIIKY